MGGTTEIKEWEMVKWDGASFIRTDSQGNHLTAICLTTLFEMISSLVAMPELEFHSELFMDSDVDSLRKLAYKIEAVLAQERSSK
jgi:hypothetical protein